MDKLAKQISSDIYALTMYKLANWSKIAEGEEAAPPPPQEEPMPPQEQRPAVSNGPSFPRRLITETNDMLRAPQRFADPETGIGRDLGRLREEAQGQLLDTGEDIAEEFAGSTGLPNTLNSIGNFYHGAINPNRNTAMSYPKGRDMSTRLRDYTPRQAAERLDFENNFLEPILRNGAGASIGGSNYDRKKDIVNSNMMSFDGRRINIPEYAAQAGLTLGGMPGHLIPRYGHSMRFDNGDGTENISYSGNHEAADLYASPLRSQYRKLYGNPFGEGFAVDIDRAGNPYGPTIFPPIRYPRMTNPYNGRVLKSEDDQYFKNGEDSINDVIRRAYNYY